MKVLIVPLFFMVVLMGCGKVQFASSDEYIQSLKVSNPQVIINDDKAFTNQQSVRLHLQVVNATEMYITNDPSCETGGEWQPFVEARDWDLSELNQEVSVYAKFRRNEKYESECVTDSIIHDDIPPTLNLVETPEVLNGLKSVRVGFMTTDENSGLDKSLCGLDQNALQYCSEHIEVSVNEGYHSVSVKSWDKAGNGSEIKITQWYSDQTGPDVKLIQVPKAYDNQKNQVLLFEANDHSGVQNYECSLNGSPWQSCRENHFLSNLPEGANVFYVRAQDKVGNWSLPVNASWVSDFTPPQVEWLFKPEDFSSLKKERLSFRGVDQLSPSYYYCSIDIEAFQRCEPKEFYSKELVEGNHQYRIYGVDEAGNQSKLMETKWLTDFTPPILANLSLPQHMTNKTDGVIQFQVEDKWTHVASIRCSINGQTFPCSTKTNETLSHQTIGVKNLNIEAVDRVGNILRENLKFTVYQEVTKETEDLDITDHGELDLLFVMDNSGSMDDEQEKMSKRFSSFLPYLEDINWHIAITTTDLREKDKDYQDGQLVHFGETQHRWIEPSMGFSVANDLFKSTIQRKENGSDTESGVGASYRVLERFANGESPHTGFFRDKANFNIVVVSDEDESINEFKKNPGRLVDSVAKLWPGKDFSFHSIVVNEGDDDCKDTFGHRVGKTYEWLSDRTNGVKASVCSKDYAEPLSHIGDKIRNAFRTIKLKCPPVDRDGDGVIDIEVNRSDFPKYTVNGSQLVLEELIPLGKYQIQYYCAVD